MHLTSHITHSNGYAPYIAYYRSNGFDQWFRKLKPKPKLNPPNAHRSQVKICEKWHTHNVQFRFMPNAFRILKPIQKSSKRVWVFRYTGANAFAKNQMRLAYEDKRDLYCTCTCTRIHSPILVNFILDFHNSNARARNPGFLINCPMRYNVELYRHQPNDMCHITVNITALWKI